MTNGKKVSKGQKKTSSEEEVFEGLIGN